MKVSVRLEGFQELDAALGEFTKATARNVLRRTGIDALEPVAEAMRDKAPVQLGGDSNLRESIAVSTMLNKRQRRMSQKATTVEVYVGPAGTKTDNAPPQGVQQEFGNENHGPQPFARPAWDGTKGEVLDQIKTALATQIDKATLRAQRKALKVRR